MQYCPVKVRYVSEFDLRLFCPLAVSIISCLCFILIEARKGGVVKWREREYHVTGNSTPFSEKVHRLILDTCAGLKLFINNEWMLLCQE